MYFFLFCIIYVWIQQGAWMVSKYMGMKDWTAWNAGRNKGRGTEYYHIPDTVNTCTHTNILNNNNNNNKWLRKMYWSNKEKCKAFQRWRWGCCSTFQTPNCTWVLWHKGYTRTHALVRSLVKHNRVRQIEIKNVRYEFCEEINLSKSLNCTLIYNNGILITQLPRQIWTGEDSKWVL